MAINIYTAKPLLFSRCMPDAKITGAYSNAAPKTVLHVHYIFTAMLVNWHISIRQVAIASIMVNMAVEMSRFIGITMTSLNVSFERQKLSLFRDKFSAIKKLRANYQQIITKCYIDG